MRSRITRRGTVSVGIGLLGWCTRPATGECYDPTNLCTDPCPAASSCSSDDDCPSGMICGGGCAGPSFCLCGNFGGSFHWSCTFDCAGQCEEPRRWTGIPEYLIIDLGTLGGWTANAQGINDCGQVVGSADTRQGVRHAFLWDTGRMTDLGTLGDLPISEALDINNCGQVVGEGSEAVTQPYRGFIWENGVMTDLGDLGGPETTVHGVNDAGVVVGLSSYTPTRKHSFLWRDGAMIDLVVVLGAGSFIAAIGERDQLVGSQALGDEVRATLWANGVARDVGTLGGRTAVGLAISEGHQVVGASERAPGGDRVFHAFVWDDGVITDLSALGGFSASNAKDINDAGQVIGEPAFLFGAEKGVRRLEDLIPPSRWDQFYPYAINNAGQIVGWAEFRQVPRAFLMTPLTGDFDGDEQSDLRDGAAIAACLSGPGALVEESCKPCDVNRNGSVDLIDVQAFQWVFGAP